MLSPNKRGRRLLGALVLAAALQTAPAAPQPDAVSTLNLPEGHAPQKREIARAVEIVKADPNLATERKVRSLKWVDASHPPESSDSSSSAGGGSLTWIFELISWVAQSARTLVWVAIAVLIGLLATYLIRLLRSGNAAARTVQSAAPTHVQDLDIRPESLPENIGATARKLWDDGEHRAALSLLYRGLLSRLAHVHNVPIRDSSTEGDCLRLAGAKLREAQSDYVKRLIQIWLQAVYGGLAPETGSLYALCDEFAPALDAQ